MGYVNIGSGNVLVNQCSISSTKDELLLIEL